MARSFTVGAALAGAVLLAAAFAPAAAFADGSTLYVGGANCSDAGPNSQAQPYCTIGKAAAVATAGQTVLVAAGTYPEKVTAARSGLVGAPIVVQAAPGATVTATGGANGFLVSGRQYVTINGFSVTRTSSYGIYVSGSSNVVVAGNTVTYAGQPVSGQIAAGILLSNTSASTVTGNNTNHNSDTGIYLKSGTTTTTVSYNESSFNANQYQRNANGINVIGPDNIIIGNRLHDNEDSGLQFYTGGNDNLATLNVSYNNGDHGIDDLNVTGGRLIGNTIYRNCTTGINVEGTSGNYLVENNISVDNAVFVVNPTPITGYTNACKRRAGNIGIWDSAPSSTTVNANLVYLTVPGTLYVFGSPYSSLAAMQAATGQEQLGRQADPLFASMAGFDLRLTEGSPAIDSADSGAPAEPATDVTGATRVDDTTVADTGIGPRTYDDRGAYEFGGGTGGGGGGGPLPPTAALSVSPGSGTAPLAVTADASGSTDPQGQALMYSFAFGDGTGAGPQPNSTATHTYAAAGSFTVTVTVTDTAGLSATAQQTVTVSPGGGGPQPPTAVLTVSPSSGTAPLAVTADASGSTDPQGQSLTFSFAFGDGTGAGPQASPTATHTYAAAGSFTVTVTVTDMAGLSGTAQQAVSVSAPSGGGNPAYVSQIATNYSTTLHTSGSITVWRAQGVAVGDLAVLSVELTGTGATGTVAGTDDAGNTYAVAQDVADGSGNRLVVLYGLVRTALVPNNRIAVSFPSSATYRIVGDELSGVTTLDRHAGASGTGSVFASGSTGVTASAQEFVFGAVGVVAGTTPAWASGWTALTSYAVGTNYLGRADQISSTVGTFNASGTASGSWLAACVTFQ